MRVIFTISIFTLLIQIHAHGQIFNDSIYQSWWANKDRSIFQDVDSGEFSGTTTGYLHVVRDTYDTLVLDFKATKTILDIEIDPYQMYDNSTKHYITATTSGKTTLIYDTYALANALTIILSGQKYQFGTIDGACDMPIAGLIFNYCNEPSAEYLTLFISEPLELTTRQHLAETNQISYSDAKKNAKTLRLLPGSTIIFTIRR